MANKEIALANKIITSRYRLTDIECRLVFHLIGRIKKEDADFIDYRYTTKELLQALNMTSNNIAQLTASLVNISQKIIHINTGKGWIIYHWFEVAEYIKDEGIIRLRFNSELKPYLLRLKDTFTLLDFQTMMKLSVHSRRVYMLAKKDEWQHQKKRISLAEFREVLELGKSYTSYKNLRVRVLEPAVKEINEQSDIMLTITPDKTTKIKNLYSDLIFDAKLKPPLKQIAVNPQPKQIAAKSQALEDKSRKEQKLREERIALGHKMDKLLEKRWAALPDKEQADYMVMAEARARGLEALGFSPEEEGHFGDLKLLAIAELGKDLEETKDREYCALAARYNALPT